MAARTIYSAKFDDAIMGHYADGDSADSLCRAVLDGPYAEHLLPVSVCPVCARVATGSTDHRLVQRSGGPKMMPAQ